MISPEFKAAVSEKNLLRTRIMLKDSFVVDPTFAQLSEMLSYAKMYLPDLMVSYDDDYLEQDPSKWSFETMNEELVQLVNNFSDIRVNHLKEVVSKIFAKEAEMIRRKRIPQNAQNIRTTQQPLTPPIRSSLNISIGISNSKEVKRKEALRIMSTEARKINKVIYKVDENHNRWTSQNVDDLECAAQEILKAVSEYKKINKEVYHGSNK